MLKRHAIRDALSAADDVAFHKALGRIAGINGEKARDAVETKLREREKSVAREIRLVLVSSNEEGQSIRNHFSAVAVLLLFTLPLSER